jgi:hypothetical protein
MRGLCAVFHQTGASSFQFSVEQVWKLCKNSSKRKVGPRFPTASAARKTYFGHERCIGKRVPAGQLDRFSTFPSYLLLLLVL